MLFIWVNGKRVRGMGKESRLGRMGRCMRGIGRTGWLMVMED